MVAKLELTGFYKAHRCDVNITMYIVDSNFYIQWSSESSEGCNFQTCCGSFCCPCENKGNKIYRKLNRRESPDMHW